VSFDGSGDYLELSDSADFDLGSGDFTIEFFVYTRLLRGKLYLPKLILVELMPLLLFILK